VESAPTPPGDLIESLTAYLRLDDDLPSIQRRLARDPRCRDGILAYPGMRIMRQEPWETLAGFILSSTSNIPRIARTMELIAECFGERLTLDGASRRTFPRPEVLAEAGEARLRELGCGFRAPYLAAAARAVADGTLPLVRLRGAPYQVAHDALVTLRGVGDKIADCVMLFSLDRPEAFPVDRWVLRVLVDWYDLDPKIDYAAARQWAWNRFGQHAGYANQYLFWRKREAGRNSSANASISSKRR